ncbi:MAG: hypothetical protein L6R48_20870 [Planctomycetes bacterium]|nr:hypothetical protein [Planctomycetota bacterium]
MPAPRKILAAAPTLAPADPAQVVAFACAPEWLAAEAGAPGADGQPAKAVLPRFSMVAYTGGPMRLQGWRHPVIVDLAGLVIPTQHRPIRLGHDAAHGVGHTDSLRVEGGKLIAAGVVSRDTSAAREVVISSKNGFPWQASIGAAVEEHEFVREGGTVHVNGRAWPGPVNVVRRSSLGEISFVDLGADGNTSALVTAHTPAATPSPIDSGESLVKNASAAAPSTSAAAAAAPADTATPTAPAAPAAAAAASAAPAVQAAATPAAPAAQAGAPAVQPVPVVQATASAPTAAAGASVADLRAAAVQETERIAAVRKLCHGEHSAIEAQAIREGWDATRTELEVLRAARPTAPAAHIRSPELTQEVLEAACLLSAQHAQVEEACSEQALTSAQRRFRGGIGLQELLLEAAWANGYTGRSFRDTREILRAAFPGGIQAGGLSTIDIGGILSNVANRFLLDGFGSVESTWRNIAVVGPVTDFKAITRYRLIGKDQYDQVAPGGQLKHGTLGETKYQNQADTYGLMLAIDRRDLINDDLGAITTVPRKLGRGAGLKINDVFWTTFLNHGAFFSAANKNLLAGADTALTIDGLTKAETAFLEQVDPDGKPLGTMPSIILVPPALSAYGTQLFKSLELRDASPGGKYPVSNPHQGKFRVEVSRYLSNPQYAGNSAKAWYLLADPADLPVIEVVFLNGQEAPVIETATADFNVLGVQMRGYHDFGVALQEPRAGMKSKGEA